MFAPPDGMRPRSNACFIFRAFQKCPDARPPKSRGAQAYWSYVELRGMRERSRWAFFKGPLIKNRASTGMPGFSNSLVPVCDYFFTGAAGAGAGAGAAGAGAGAAAFSGAFSGAGAGAAAGAGAGFFSSCLAQPTKEKETASKRASTSTSAFFIRCFTSF